MTMDEPEVTSSVSSSEASSGKTEDVLVVAPTESLKAAITEATDMAETTIPATTITSTITTTTTAIPNDIPAKPAVAVASKTNGTNGTANATKSQNVPPWRSYNGPKLYVKPVSRTSNQQIIHKAVAKALEGAANANTLEKIQETLQANLKTSNHFLILFRNHQFKGIYDYNEKQATITKLDGLGPKTIGPENIVRFYKFDSTKRAFTEVETKQIGPTIIAISLSSYTAKSK